MEREMLKKIDIYREAQRGKGLPGAFFLSDSRALLPQILAEYRGRVQLIYLDPPFLTGQRFSMRMRVGEREWKSGTGSLILNTYDDDMEKDAYLAMMREILTGAHALLKDSGVLFLHIDYRMHAHLRLMMDEIFGEGNLLNEIIWSYQTGGRARRYFSRKHDVILFYRKGRGYCFDINAVAVSRAGNRRNHMKKLVDADGRTYRSIRTGNKIYTYYDDEPTFPSDVWDDLSHMQQKDPQRTGYDTQKPLTLLERIILSGSRPGDLVMDLFAGSGTTLEAAHANGRRFIGADQSPLSYYAISRRMAKAEMTYDARPAQGEPVVEAHLTRGIAFHEVELKKYELEPGVSARSFSGLDALDNWSVGYVRGDAYAQEAREMRTKHQGALTARLKLPVYEGAPVMRVCDVFGRVFYYLLDVRN
jgi:DNA modification methylase